MHLLSTLGMGIVSGVEQQLRAHEALHEDSQVGDSQCAPEFIRVRRGSGGVHRIPRRKLAF